MPITVDRERNDGILRQTRTRFVSGRVDLGNGFSIGAESFQRGLYPHWGILRNNHGEAFLLTERDFPTINAALQSLPGRTIRERLALGGEPVILDLGGGRDGIAARYVSERYGVRAINIDVVAVNEEIGLFICRQGDLRTLPAEDNSVDVAYSHQVFPFVAEASKKKGIGEVERVLKPGGRAFLDVDNGGDNGVPWRDCLESRYSKHPDFKLEWGQKSYGGNFVVLTKK